VRDGRFHVQRRHAHRSPAFGTPEYCNAVLASAQIGRRLKIPVRTSAVNASPEVDAQSTYETAFSLQAAILSHST